MEDTKAKEAKEVKAEVAPTLDIKQFKEVVNEAVAKHLEDVKAAKKEFAVNETPVSKARLDKAARREQTIQWMKATTDKDQTTLKSIHDARAKALNEATGYQGGYLVPEEFEKSIIRYMDLSNQIAQNATTMIMSTDVKRLNALSGNTTAYIVGEQSAITASTPSFTEPVLTAKKYAAIAEWSSEFAEDTEVDNILGLLAADIGRQIAVKEQQEFLSGTTSGSEGILQASGVTASAFSGAASTLDWTDLSLMIAELQAIDLVDGDQAKFYMAPQTYHYLRTLQTSGDGNYFLPAAPSAQTPATAWGKEIVLVKEMTKQSSAASGNKFIFLSDLKNHAVVGRRRGITSKILTEGTVGSNNLGEQDMEALRITSRAAFVTRLPNGIVTLAPTA